MWCGINYNKFAIWPKDNPDPFITFTWVYYFWQKGPCGAIK